MYLLARVLLRTGTFVSQHVRLPMVKKRTRVVSFLSVALEPEIVLPAIVERKGTSTYGSLVVALIPVWERIQTLLQSDPGSLMQLSPTQWEELVAASYDRAGFDEVILTPRSGDYGRDVIAVKHGYWSVRIIDQVKAYKPGHLVEANDIRALLGVMVGDPNVSKGVVTTTSNFAPKIIEDPFIKPFLPHRLELVNGPDLVKRLLDGGSSTR